MIQTSHFPPKDTSLLKVGTCKVATFSIGLQNRVGFGEYWPALMVSKSLGLWATMRWTSALRPTPGGPTSTWNNSDILFFHRIKAFSYAQNDVQFSFTIYVVNALDCWYCYQGFAGERGDPLNGLVQLQVGGVHLGVLLESVTKPLLLLLLQRKISAKKIRWHFSLQRKEPDLTQIVPDWPYRILYISLSILEVWSMQLIIKTFVPQHIWYCLKVPPSLKVIVIEVFVNAERKLC